MLTRSLLSPRAPSALSVVFKNLVQSTQLTAKEFMPRELWLCFLYQRQNVFHITMFTVLIEEICEQFSVIVCLTVLLSSERHNSRKKVMVFFTGFWDWLPDTVNTMKDLIKACLCEPHGISTSKWTESENLGHLAKSTFK